MIKEYNDFAQVASESIAEMSQDGSTTNRPLWSKEEADEIVIAQVGRLVKSCTDVDSIRSEF